MERLELTSRTGTVTSREEKGPYSPVVITQELHQTIKGICGSGKEPQRATESYEPTIDPTERKESKYSFKVEPPKFNGQDYPSFVEKFSRFLRLSGMQDAPEQLKLDWLVQSAEPNVYPLVLNTVKECKDLETTMAKLGTIFPTLENDVTLRKRIEALPTMSYAMEPHQVTTFFLEFETLTGKLSPEAWTDQDRLLSLISKLHTKTFQELRANPSYRPLTDNYADLKGALLKKVQEDWADRKLGLLGGNKEHKSFSVLTTDTPMAVDPPQSNRGIPEPPRQRQRKRPNQRWKGQRKRHWKGQRQRTHQKQFPKPTKPVLFSSTHTM